MTLAIADFLAAFGLILVLEGLLYAALPETMKRMVAMLLALPADTMRTAGVVVAVVGVLIVWLVRG